MVDRARHALHSVLNVNRSQTLHATWLWIMANTLLFVGGTLQAVVRTQPAEARHVLSGRQSVGRNP